MSTLLELQRKPGVVINIMILFMGEVDSPESPETPEITGMTENFTKVTKYLTKLKDTLINYAQEKSHVINSENKIFR